MRLLMLYADTEQEWNCSEWRVVIPSDAIDRTGEHQTRYLSVWDALKPSASPHIEWAQLIVIERIGWGPVAEFIRRLKGIGKKVMLDFDDAYHLMPPSVSTHLLWRRSYLQVPKDVKIDKPDGFFERGNGKRVPVVKAQKRILAEFRKTLKIVDAFSTPSEILTQDFAHLNPRHYVIKNYPDLTRAEWHTKKRGHGNQIIIGWGGSSTHLESFMGSGVIQALNQIIRNYPMVRLWICTADERIVEAIRIPPEKKVIVKWGPFREWPKTLDNFDIGIAPLAGKYDERRSWIKVLEYALKGIPWVATDGSSYRDCEGGFWVENKPKHWYRWLKRLVEDSSVRHVLARDGQRWARTMGVDAHIGERLEIYQEVFHG